MDEQYTSPVKSLVDNGVYTIEEIAAKTGASASAVWGWYRGAKPRKVYLRKLLTMIKKKEKNVNHKHQ